ncbi:SDR family oxidoreductase [Paraburkholderia panacisoli]|uniref:SDR family oxidoreductase n=1 Tax=Paraburkholderia panacisoli TaxID=2603818 RepID=A0A5B0G7F2_9BURK|nr:SDR family oxidoreductase [Paraburkholderia panacisoli]
MRLTSSGRGRQSPVVHVVNVPSISATTDVASNVACCAAKAGLDTMTASLARALAPRIRVLNVSPGVGDTSFVSGRGADFNDKVAATTPRGRIGTPDDTAAAIEACTTHLTFSTGVTIIEKHGPFHERATERARKSACAGRARLMLPICGMLTPNLS